jgi:hypothetical protein
MVLACRIPTAPLKLSMRIGRHSSFVPGTRVRYTMWELRVRSFFGFNAFIDSLGTS